MFGGTGSRLCQQSDLWRHTAQDFEKAGQLRDREMELKAQISAITGAAKETTDAEAETTAEGSGPMVTDADIAHIVAQWTGIPVEKVRWAETHVSASYGCTARPAEAEAKYMQHAQLHPMCCLQWSLP